MKLTIEKAKQIVKHYIKTDEPMEGDIHGSDMAWGFIAGWNQAIEKIVSEIETDPDQYLKINELKVKGEK